MTETREIVFARIGNKGYMAGSEFGAILSYARNIYHDISKTEILMISEQSIPQEYQQSAQRAKQFATLTKSANIYLLIKNPDGKNNLFADFSHTDID